MVELAEKASFCHAMWQMGEAIVNLYEQVTEAQPLLQNLPTDNAPNWRTLTQRWVKK